MVSHDYSDSGSDDEREFARAPVEDDLAPGSSPEREEEEGNDLDDDILMASEGPSSRPEKAAQVDEAPVSGSSTSQNIRIKLRHPKVTQPERSSLSPPPPITLKFGLPSRSAKAEKAAYSSSEGEEDEPTPREAEAKPPVSKKARKSVPGPSSAVTSPKKRSMNPAISAVHAGGAGGGSHRKSYDWLIPSTAGASHHGPEGREEHSKKPIPKVTGWQPGDTPELDGDIFAGHGVSTSSPAASASGKGSGAKSAEAKAAAAEARRRNHKKRKEGEPPGPGKAWRRGLKKGVAGPKKDGMDSPMGSTPDQSRPGSPEGTPEADAGRVVDAKAEFIVDDDTPFVLADAAVLGFPVFSKPIVPPRMTLSNFPKVTPYFTPNNGGDTGPFPRREPVRPWKHSDRTIVGVGGGTLKFKSWTKGPPSELSLILQAEKEAQDTKNKMPKEGAESKAKSSKATPIAIKAQEGDDQSIKNEPSTPAMGAVDVDASPTPGSSPPPQQPLAKKPRPSIKGEGKKTKPKPKTPRPTMTHSTSTDSLASMSSAGGLDDGGDQTPVQTGAKGPRKSKLAHEIRPEAELVESP